MLPLLALSLHALAAPIDSTHCVAAAAFLRDSPRMVAEIEADTINDWRSGQRVVSCRITAAGATDIGVNREAVRFYERVRAAGWTRTPDPRDSPTEASLRFRHAQSDCLFNVNREALLFTDAEERVNEALVVPSGAERYHVFVICLPVLPARERAEAPAAAPLRDTVVRTADPAARGIPLTAFPRLVPLAERVYGYEEIRAPGFTTVSLIVVGDSGVLIADGQGSSAATQTMLDRIRTVTDKPVRWYVMGSDHGDHTAGNDVLPAGLTWIVHPASRAQLLRDSAGAPAGRRVIVPPVAMAGDRESIDVGGLTVDVRFLGRAHTGGDLMVHLPASRILFMSEAYLNRVFPAMRSAFPSEWVAMLDRALAMDVDRYVPGHGFIEEPAVSREELVAFRDATKAVIAEVTRLHARGLSVDSAVTAADWGRYAQWFLAEQQAPVAVRRVYAELEGTLPRAVARE